MSKFIQSLVNRMCVGMASSVGTSPNSVVVVDLVMQMLLLGCTGTAAGLSWCWSAVGAVCCVVVS